MAANDGGKGAVTMRGIAARAVVRVTSTPKRGTRRGDPALVFTALTLDELDPEAAPDHIAITAFGQLATDLAGMLKRGSELSVEGRLRLATYIGDDGAKASMLTLGLRRCAVVRHTGEPAEIRTGEAA